MITAADSAAAGTTAAAVEGEIMAAAVAVEDGIEAGVGAGAAATTAARTVDLHPAVAADGAAPPAGVARKTPLPSRRRRTLAPSS